MAKKHPSAVSAELLDELLAGQDPATVLTSGGLLGDLKKALAERMLAVICSCNKGISAIHGGQKRRWMSISTVRRSRKPAITAMAIPGRGF